MSLNSGTQSFLLVFFLQFMDLLYCFVVEEYCFRTRPLYEETSHGDLEIRHTSDVIFVIGSRISPLAPQNHKAQELLG
jgi:hypothetical protein